MRNGLEGLDLAASKGLPLQFFQALVILGLALVHLLRWGCEEARRVIPMGVLLLLKMVAWRILHSDKPAI